MMISALQLGTTNFDFLGIGFQIVNVLLWILIVLAIYVYYKNSKDKRAELENRIAKLENEIKVLKSHEK